MSLTILGQGTALPVFAMASTEAAEYAQTYICRTDEQRRQVPILYRMSGVHKRHSVVIDKELTNGKLDRQSFFPMPNDEHDLGPTIRPRMGLYEKNSTPLAVEAGGCALENAGVDPVAITHLVTASCSGFNAPGFDIGMIKQLGLSPGVARTHVGFMGCHAALNALRVANGFVSSDPDARVLLCALELCSIHYRYGWNPDSIVTNALFADGCAALVAGGGDSATDSAWRLAANGSCLIPDSEDAMTWRIDDHGFVMTLSARVPELIQRHLRPWMESWLESLGYELEGVASWAVHPGGPRILKSTAAALGLSRDDLEVSRQVLQEHGNMSSPTILFILERMRNEGASLPCVALGFGPGLVVEAALFV